MSFHVTVCSQVPAEEPISIGYIEGSGLTSISSGQLISLNLVSVGTEDWEVTFNTDVPVNIEIVSLSGWVTRVPDLAAANGCLFPASGDPCDDTYIDPLTTDFSNQDGFDLNSRVAGTTVTLRITKV